MSWNVEIVESSGSSKKIRVAIQGGYEYLDCDNARVFIDCLHTALDVIAPDWAPTPKEME